MQNYNAYEINHANYITRHFNLRIIEENENILSPYFLNWYGKIVCVVAALFFSLVLFILFLICLPFVWLSNQLFSPGPLFYRQSRVGKNGKVFTIIKFRSMKVDAESDGVARFTKENDERATAVGGFLRKTRIDELPQIINILRGEMTLIGPRPERPEFVHIFIRQQPDYKLRSLVKPGITGWGQVKYKYTSTIEEGLKKLEYDLYFIKNRNLTMDFEILCRTFITIISRSGT
jgi:lipopolysaccharide/colanic/teichoic acid biosynthesis glycosyltransferase